MTYCHAFTVPLEINGSTAEDASDVTATDIRVALLRLAENAEDELLIEAAGAPFNTMPSKDWGDAGTAQAYTIPKQDTSPQPPCKEGDRIELTAMGADDPCPIPLGTQGTVIGVCPLGDRHQVTVNWDIERSLSLACPPDAFRILPKDEYTLDVKMFTTIRVQANSEEEAQRLATEALDGAEANFGAWVESGDPILSTVSVDGRHDLIEINGEAV